MKLLVVIANHGDSQLKELERVINEFKGFSSKFNVDIVVHTSFPLNYDNVKVVHQILEDNRLLPWKCREEIYHSRNSYDLYLYTENDHLITEANIDSFLEVNEILPDHLIPGFLQYEYAPKLHKHRYFPGFTSPWKWANKPVLRKNGYTFGHFTNIHHGGFLLTKKQLNEIIAKWGEKFMEDQGFGIGGIKVQACTDVYGPHSGFKKVIPVSHLDQFLVHHLPNKYLRLRIDKAKKKKSALSHRSHRGSFETSVRDQIKLILKR